MPMIKGFKGWRYNKAKIKNLVSVLAPPYDVISKKDQESFYKKDPFNVVRLILGKEGAGDNHASNKYTRAGQYLNDWASSGVLAQDEKPTVYVYVQEYKETGKIQKRVGFLAAMKIDESAILKHENTLAAPKEDRMKLLKEVKTNLSPIFGLFEDKSGEVQKLLAATQKEKPVIDVTIDGVRHQVYLENDPARLGRLGILMRKRPMFIADGHHRFEVACQYRRLMLSEFPNENDAAWNYVMSYFSDCIHNPFTIYPTHRLVNCPKGMKDPLKVLAGRGELKKAGSLAEILKKLGQTREESSDKSYQFGLYSKKSGFFLFKLDKKYTSRIKNNPVDRLDVAVLHEWLIKPCFKIDKIEKSTAIDFTRDPKDACERVKKGLFDMALFLRPTSLQETLTASKKGLKMPQKSTYFYPKLLSGLVFHKFDD